MFGALSLLILMVGGMIFAFEAARGQIRGNALPVMGILMGTASLFLLFQTSAMQGIRSGEAPYGSEGLTFDTKFEDVKVEGRISGTVTGT